MTPRPAQRKTRRPLHGITDQSTISPGDRVAFITLGKRPKALCGIVISAGSKDKGGRRAHRVLTAGKLYIARPHATVKLILRRF